MAVFVSAHQCMKCYFYFLLLIFETSCPCSLGWFKRLRLTPSGVTPIAAVIFNSLMPRVQFQNSYTCQTGSTNVWSVILRILSSDTWECRNWNIIYPGRGRGRFYSYSELYCVLRAIPPKALFYWVIVSANRKKEQGQRVGESIRTSGKCTWTA